MYAFCWDPRFATGLDTVDAQHHRLVDAIGALSSRVGDGAEPDRVELAALYADLAAYARHHFETEERLMTEVGVDARHVARQHREHGDFCRTVEAMMGRAADAAPEASRRLVEFLAHWLSFHILGCDHAMARQVALIREGRRADEAYDAAEAPADPATEAPADPATATLLRSVSALFETLSTRNRELSALAASLEAKVAERTRELSEKNVQLEELLARMQRMAMTDSLTGLPNRRYALERLDRAWAHARREGEPLGLLLVDADGFKAVNDTHGHEAGDRVLQALAAALADAVRGGDEVCRLGGDEFVVLAPKTTLEGAVGLGERIRRRVARIDIPAGDGRWRGSVSVGAASLAPGMEEPEALLRAADTGVYAAKRAGRNAVRAAGGAVVSAEPR